MSTFKARGLVIKETVVGDADKCLIVLFKDYGKLQVWAKKSRSAKSRLLAGSTLFTYADFVIYKGKKYLTVNQIDVIEQFYNISRNLDKFATATYILELTEKNVQDSLEINDIMFLLITSLNILSKSNNIPEKLLCKIYELKFLQLSGYYPILYNCIYCEAEINYNMPIHFEFDGYVCNKCKNKFNNLISISKHTIYTINHILVTPLNDLFKFGVSKNILNELIQINKLMLVNNLHNDPDKLKSKKFLDSLDKL